MSEFLIRRFVKNYEQTEKDSVRTAYGLLGSTTGIICNILLFLGKLAAGLFLNSVSVLADAFNNLSDAASSIITFAGFKLAGKPADQDHPFGHGRLEYVSALVVAFLVLEVGLSFLKTSFQKIFSPEPLVFQLLPLMVLFFSIAIKLWMALFYKKLGKRIHSEAMLAASTDALGDILTTSATIVSLLIFRFTDLNIDGYTGMAVALFVLWAGIGIARDTLAPLIGQPVSPELCRDINNIIKSHEGILGTHDLIVHNYGPTRSLASVHAEVADNVDIQVSHEIIDHIEREVHEKLGIFLVIHMDPLCTDDAHLSEIRALTAETVRRLDEKLSLHDFRMVDGSDRINLIFDVVVPFSYSEEMQQQLRQRIQEEMQQQNPAYFCVITTEKSYVAE